MRQALSQALPPVKNKSRIDKQDAINSDIIKTIHKNFETAKKQVSKASAQFRRDTAIETAKAVWDFLRDEITYTKDPESAQMIRLPNRLVADHKGDCKSYSLFAAAVLSDLGFPVAFRYASYGSSEIPSHVYVVTKDERGNEIIVDGVWHTFNSQKPFTYKKDYIMKVLTLSGIGGKKERQEKRAGRKQKREERAEKRGGARGVKRIALSPARNAFLSLVALNVRGFATKLANSIAKDPQRTKTMWNKLGGDFNKLKSRVEKSKDKKRILGIDEAAELSGIGNPAAFAAAAAPIIVVVAKFLKGQAEGDSDLEAGLTEGLDALKSSGQEELPNNLAELDVQDAESGSGYKSPSGGSSSGTNKTLLYAGGAAAVIALIFLTKKRK